MSKQFATVHWSPYLANLWNGVQFLFTLISFKLLKEQSAPYFPWKFRSKKCFIFYLGWGLCDNVWEGCWRRWGERRQRFKRDWRREHSRLLLCHQLPAAPFRPVVGCGHHPTPILPLQPPIEQQGKPEQSPQGKRSQHDAATTGYGLQDLFWFCPFLWNCLLWCEMI